MANSKSSLWKWQIYGKQGSPNCNHFYFPRGSNSIFPMCMGGADSSGLDANYPPPPTKRWPEAALGGLQRGNVWGGGGGSGRGFWGGSRRVGWGCPGGAIWVGVGWGVHAPNARRWSITGSPYLPLPSLYPYHHVFGELVQLCQPNLVHGCCLPNHSPP